MSREQPVQRMTELILAKNREDPTDTVTLLFKAETTTLQSLIDETHNGRFFAQSSLGSDIAANLKRVRSYSEAFKQRFDCALILREVRTFRVRLGAA